MQINGLTPLLVVDAIEPVLAFWCERLGYREVARVPEKGPLGFVLLASGKSQLMLQTKESLEGDLPAIAKRKPASVLYVDVDSIASAEEAMRGAPIVVPLRETFYGAKEFAVDDGSGHVTIFAEHDR